MGGICWCVKCIVGKVIAAILGALALATLGYSLAGQLKGADFLMSAGYYLVGIVLCMAAKKAMWCVCCQCGCECGAPAKRKK